MAFWILIAFLIAFVAFQRASRVERLLLEQKKELDQLRAWLHAWYAHSQAAQGAAHAGATGEAGITGSTIAPAGQPDATPAAPAGTVSSQVVWEPTPPLGPPVAPPAAPPAAIAGASSDTVVLPAFNTAAATPAEGQAQPATAPEEEVDVLESLIGGRWLLYIGVAALVLGASYFVKYAFDNQWINEPVRVALGLLAGIALIAGGEGFAARGLATYGQALTGGGVGVLYLSVYAAYRWYGLIGELTTFASMILVTAIGVWLADRQRSQPLALLAIVVGFCTPFLFAERTGSQVALFTYDAILVCGTLALARRRDWPLLNLASYTLTLMTLASWLAVEYRPRAWLVTELFLTLFLVLFLYVWRETRRAKTPLAAAAALLLALAPVLYHVASLRILHPQRGAFLVYLIAFSAAGVIGARRGGLPWLRGLVWVGAALPLWAFFIEGLPNSWLAAAWIALLAIYGLHLVAQVDRVYDEEGRLAGLEVFLLHANGIWLMLAADALLAPRIVDVEAPVALALAVWYGLLTVAARGWRKDVALHTTALTLTLLAVAAALYFDGAWLTVALALDGAALIWLGLKADRPWMHLWGAVVLISAIVRTLTLLGETRPVGYLPILNPFALAGLFVVAVMAALAWLYPRDRPGSSPGSSPDSSPDSSSSRRGGWLPGVRDALIVGANLLMLVVLSSEVYAFFGRRAWVRGVEIGSEAAADTAAELSRELSLSILWAVYAVGLVFVGIRRHYRPIRYLAILLFGFTILKVFMVDIARLDRVYKMLSVMGLGVLLLIASYLYQRVRADLAGTPAPPAPPAPPVEPATSPDAETQAGATPDESRES